MPDAPDFDSLLEAYARFRTGYSPALFDLVLRGRALPRVLDVGAGTGLAAKDLAPRARRFVAVDVARAMLRRCPGERALAKAEALPFRDASFDVVTCAQAFHWVDPAPAYREFHRVLRPGGLAAIWWKYEAPDDKTAQAADAAFERVVGKPAPSTPLETQPLPELERAPFARVTRRVLRWELPLSVDAYVGYHASRENLRRAAGPLRETVLDAMRADLLAMHPSGRFVMLYEQRVWLLERD